MPIDAQSIISPARKNSWWNISKIIVQFPRTHSQLFRSGVSGLFSQRLQFFFCKLLRHNLCTLIPPHLAHIAHIARSPGHHHQLRRRRRNGPARVHRAQLLAARTGAERTHHHAADSRADAAGTAAATAASAGIDVLTKNSYLANLAPTYVSLGQTGITQHKPTKNNSKFFNSGFQNTCGRIVLLNHITLFYLACIG